MLQENKLTVHAPTMRPYWQDFEMPGSGNKYRLTDLGGSHYARKIWLDYFNGATTGMIFVIDATDSSRFQEAGECLLDLIAKLPKNQAHKVPILIVFSKIDKFKTNDCALSTTELIALCGIDKISENQNVVLNYSFYSFRSMGLLTTGLAWLDEQLYSHQTMFDKICNFTERNSFVLVMVLLAIVVFAIWKNVTK